MSGTHQDEDDRPRQEALLLLVQTRVEATALKHDASQIHQYRTEQQHTLHGVVVPEERHRAAQTNTTQQHDIPSINHPPINQSTNAKAKQSVGRQAVWP